MSRKEHAIIALFIMLGLFHWILDALLASTLFSAGPLAETLLTAVPLDEVLERLGVLFLLTLCGTLVALDMARRRRMHEVLQEGEQRIRHQAERAEVLVRTAARLNAHLDVDSVVRAVCEEVGQVLDVPIATVYLHDAQSDALVLAGGIGIVPEYRPHLLPIPRALYEDAVRRIGPLVVIPDVQAVPGIPNADLVAATDARTVALATMTHEGQLVGMLNAVSLGRVRHFAEELPLLQGLADQAALAIANARLFGERRQAEETLQRRTAQLEVLQDVGLELTAQLDLEALLHSIVAHAIRLIGAVDGGLYLYRADRDILERAVSVGETIPVGSTLRRGEGLSGQVWETGQPLSVDSYQSWLGRAPAFRSEPDRAVLGVAVRWAEEFLGVLNVAALPPRTFGPADAELLGLFATQAAIAIRNAQTLAAVEQQRRRAESLAVATAALTTTLELEPLLENVLKAAIQAIPAAEKGSVLLWGEGGDLHVRAVVGYEDLRVRSARFQRGQGYAAQAAEEGVPLLIGAARNEAVRYTGEIEEMRAIQSAIVAPLRYRGQIIGVLSLDNASSQAAFSEEDLQLLAIFANHAALAVGNARLYGDLQQQMEQVRNTQAQLVQSARLAAVGELAAGVAHELNNPLTGILGFAQLLLEDLPADAPSRRDLEAIAAAAQRARGIVYNLLDFARQGSLWRQPADINRLLRQTLSLMRIHLERSGVLILEEYADGLGTPSVDAAQIEQVFLNLIRNAAQAMSGGGTLCLHTEQVGDEVAVSFSDTGPGISPEAQKRLFEPFFTTKPEGVGLGLAVSAGIVQEHGGRITVESRPGHGSTFTVWLPLASEETATAPDRPAALSAYSPSSEPGELR